MAKVMALKTGKVLTVKKAKELNKYGRCLNCEKVMDNESYFLGHLICKNCRKKGGICV